MLYIQARPLGAAAGLFSSSAPAAAAPPSAALAGAFAAVAACAAAAAYASESPSSSTMGPLATVTDMDSIQSRLAEAEADSAYPGRRTNSVSSLAHPKLLTSHSKLFFFSVPPHPEEKCTSPSRK